MMVLEMTIERLPFAFRYFHLRLLTLSFVLIVVIIGDGSSQAPKCCDRVTGSCAIACKQISLMTLASARNDLDFNHVQFRSIQLQCSAQQMSFWNCINETITAVKEGGSWEGRSCCSLSQTPLCQMACFTAAETADIQTGCRRSDEPSLYHCLQRQIELESCCGQSNRPDCVATCQSILRDSGRNNSQPSATRRKLNSVCERESSVISCVLNITQTTNAPVPNPHKFLPCCAQGRNVECKDACRRAFQSQSANEKFIMDSLLEKGCGHPRPDDKMWGCIFQNVDPKGTASPSKIQRLGMDAPKLHCCHRAQGETCRRLCYNTYSREWTGSWADLDSVCLSSSEQLDLRTCVDDLDEPCELGCDGLSFCSGFNDRPSDLFRRCNKAADQAAREQFERWMSMGFIPLDSYQLPLRNDSNCAREKWKSVACALELKPCHPKTHTTQICRSDCVALLHECLDFDQFLSSGQEVSAICSLLSPPQGKPCISLSQYTVPRKHLTTSHVSRPCQGRPCNSSQICQLNRSSCAGNSCRPYVCPAGCKLGEMSKIVVEIGSLVRIPYVESGNGCHRLCRCSTDGLVENCILPNCEAPSPCWLRKNRIDHGTTFTVDCNFCSCRSGEIVCTKHGCKSTDLTTETAPTLPCNCVPMSSPVCGSNGKTYFSNCIARCSGLSDAEIVTGSCDQRDPCDGVFCGNGHRCISFRRVCLHPFARRCQQYQCLPYKCSAKDVVCDIEGRQYENMCTMANAGGIFSHKGPCLKHSCSPEGVVCGVDGVTYQSECVVEGRGIPKDYDGPCRFFGVRDDARESTVSCPFVDCHPLPGYCSGVVPAGACCPVCAGILSVIYSPTQVLRLAELTDTQLVTIDEMGKKLSGLVQTAECRLGIYLGMGTEMFVIIRPKWTPWTKIKLQACVSETERLVALIVQQSPIMQVDGVLNLLTGASFYEISGEAWIHRQKIFNLILLLLVAISC